MRCSGSRHAPLLVSGVRIDCVSVFSLVIDWFTVVDTFDIDKPAVADVMFAATERHILMVYIYPRINVECVMFQCEWNDYSWNMNRRER